MIKKAIQSLYKERYYCNETHRQASAKSTGAATGKLPKCTSCGAALRTNAFHNEFRSHTNTSQLPPALYRSYIILKNQFNHIQQLLEEMV